MKVVIEKQFNNIGDEYMEETEVTANIRKVNDELVIEVDGVMYSIPMGVFYGVINSDTN